jgi:DNA primase small subunit
MGSSLSFVRNKFAEYYQRNSSFIQPPTSIEKREFGFLLLKERFMLRHKGFENVGALRSFLKTTVPSDVYYSSAYYERPEEKMEEKGWLGADLIFDIDADHIPTPCDKIHDSWVCKNCGTADKGPPPEKCPKCGEQKFDGKTWPCEVCLETAKAETLKLIDMLSKDFGFSLEEMRVSFSGHRGYHLHIESEEIREMDQMARKEIVDYVVGIGLEAGLHGLEETSVGGRSRMLVGPNLDEMGWRGRIARGTYEFLLTATPEDLKRIGLKRHVVKTLLDRRESILESWKERGPWGKVKNVGVESWKRIALHGAQGQAAKIDTVVTTDIHRLIRMSNSLHGKTGLKKVEVPIKDIEDFDPFKSGTAFKAGSVTVFVSDSPRFRVGEQIYEPFKEQRVELPTAAALLLLCKGAATVVE